MPREIDSGTISYSLEQSPPDLGVIPESVDFNFVYCDHTEITYPRIAQLLLEGDAIAIEEAKNFVGPDVETGQTGAELVHLKFATLNGLSSGELKPKEKDAFLKRDEINGYTYGYLPNGVPYRVSGLDDALATGLVDSGKPIFPVDDGTVGDPYIAELGARLEASTPIPFRAMQQKLEEVRESMLDTIRWNALWTDERDRLVASQLAQISRDLSNPGNANVCLRIMQGGIHIMTSAMLDDAGARVHKSFVSEFEPKDGSGYTPTYLEEATTHMRLTGNNTIKTSLLDRVILEALPVDLGDGTAGTKDVYGRHTTIDRMSDRRVRAAWRRSRRRTLASSIR